MSINGYYPTTTAPALPSAPVTSQAPALGAPVLVGSSDTYIQTSSTNPLFSGIRSSAGSIAALRGVPKAAASARLASLKSASTTAVKGRNAASRIAGRKPAMMRLNKSQTALAKTHAGRQILTKDVHVGVGESFFRSFFSVGNLARAIGGSALIAIPMSAVTDFLDWREGRTTADQRNALIVADSIGYTATGATATLMGGAIGSTFMGPGVGTVVGIAAGFGLGWVYEKYIRPTFGNWIHNALYKTPLGAPPPPAPVPTPTPPPILGV
jgi:hypothetical protein